MSRITESAIEEFAIELLSGNNFFNISTPPKLSGVKIHE